MRDLDGKCGDGVEIMIVKNIPSSFFFFFFFEGRYVETLQNDHDTNSEIERERWWKDLFILTPLRTNDEDIGTRVNHHDDFSKLRNNYITDSVFLF